MLKSRTGRADKSNDGGEVRVECNEMQSRTKCIDCIMQRNAITRKMHRMHMQRNAITRTMHRMHMQRNAITRKMHRMLQCSCNAGDASECKNALHGQNPHAFHSWARTFETNIEALKPSQRMLESRMYFKEKWDGDIPEVKERLMEGIEPMEVKWLDKNLEEQAGIIRGCQ